MRTRESIQVRGRRSPGAFVLTLAVVAGLIAFMLSFLHKSGPDDQDKVRKYYESRAGGSAPRRRAERLRVDECYETGDSVADVPIVDCFVTLGHRRWDVCFAIDERVYRAGKQVLGIENCAGLEYSRRKRRFVYLR
jgi:hypothetical protein